MNILEIEDLIKGLPDQALMQEAQQPSGRMPQYLVVSEIQRRGDMRKRFQAQQQGQDRGTVAQQILQGGVQERPAPQMQASMGQPPGMMPPMGAQRPPTAPPATMPPRPPMGAPQGIAALPQGGGIPGPQAAQMAAQAPVRMADGQRVPSIYDLDRDPFLVNMGLIQPPGVPLTDREIGLMATEDLMQAARDRRISDEAARQEYQARVGRSPLERLDEFGGKLEDRTLQFLSMPANLTGDVARRVGEFAFESGPRDVGSFIRYLTTPTRESDFDLPTEIADGRPGGSAADQMLELDALSQQLRGLDGAGPVSDPKQSSAVQTDASRININAGYPAPGQTTLDEDLLEMGTADIDPESKVKRDLLGDVLGGASRYAPGNVPSIGSVDPVAYAKGRIPADMEVEVDEEGVARVKGDRPGDILFNQYMKAMTEQDDPTRSYKELLDTIAGSRDRDYSEGTAAAAAIRSESEAEQKRLQEEGRSAALSDALIALGAGIAGGDLAGGLSRAGQAATAARKEFQTAARQERRYGTLEARAEERAARAARSAAEMQELGVKGRQIEADYEAAINKNKRELAIGKAFVDRADALGIRQDRAEELVVSAMETVSRNLAALAREGQLTQRSLIGLKEELVKAVPAPFGGDDQSRREWATTINDIYRDLASEYVGGGRGAVNSELEGALFGSIGER